ncbi:hypothetical protein SAMN05216232_3630 [Virgibacillus subterraneus]|uniref:Uncharacterized protein n=2 Tax=Virgibacillus TaxID=84406 RepID=A0A1H1DQP9_9BACI|nr:MULTISPECIES: hypothetical protein [Virgibacillus]SDQ78690.1 hypothetical protein SAMN05216231_2525 [Virgibacillus salinus]SEQ90108.1 hypothetical protein SAMN05216232_3630 [Virgibacillus subterraneus]
MILNGNIISGEFDDLTNEFVLQRIKHFSTESIIKENQLNDLSEYLNNHKHEANGQILTLYDQMLVPLSRKEIIHFLEDLDKVRALYH